MAHLPIHFLPPQSDSLHTIHLLPFHINYSGPASVSDKFILFPSALPNLDHEQEDEEGLGSHQHADQSGDAVMVESAAFRGRLLFSTETTLPAHYKGLVTQVKAPLSTLGPSRDALTARKRPAASTSGSLAKKPKLSALRPQAKMQFSLDSDSDAEDTSASAPISTVSSSSQPMPIDFRSSPRRSPRKTSSAFQSPKSPSKSSPRKTKVRSPEPEVIEDVGDLPLDKITLQTIGSFDTFRIWSPDAPLDKGADPFFKAVNEFVNLADIVFILFDGDCMNLIGLLWLFTYAAATVQYDELLSLYPLPDGKLLTRFEFTFAADSAHIHGFEWPGIADYYDSGLLPRSLATLISAHSVAKLDFTMTAGRWQYDIWGDHPLRQGAEPPGSQISAWIADDSEWNPLVNTLAGLFCASVNKLDDAHTVRPSSAFASIHNTSHILRHGFLPLENPCTENLTPVKNLLPCRNLAGLSQLLDPHKLFEASYQSIGIHLDHDSDMESLSVTLEIDLVRDPPREERMRGGRGRRDFSFKDLFGKTVEQTCHVARSSLVRLHSDAFLPSPVTVYKPTRSDWQEIRPDVLQLDMLAHPLPTKVAVEWPSETAHIYPTAYAQPKVCINRISTAFGQERGVIGVEIINNANEVVQAIWLEELPWWIRLYMHTMTVDSGADDNPIQSMNYSAARDRTSLTVIEVQLSLGPRSAHRIVFDYDKAYLRYTEYPSDASRGFAVPPALLEYASDGKTRRVYTTTDLIMAPLPDFSMPYNVIVLSSTVWALIFGSIFNLLTRQFVAVNLAANPQKPS